MAAAGVVVDVVDAQGKIVRRLPVQSVVIMCLYEACSLQCPRVFPYSALTATDCFEVMSDQDSPPTVNGLDPSPVKEVAPRRETTGRDLALWAVAGTVLVFPLVFNPWLTRRAVKRLGEELEAAIKSSSSRAESAIFRLQSHQDGASTTVRGRLDAIDLRMSNDSRVMRELLMERIRVSNEFVERRVDALQRRLLEAQADRSNVDEQQQATNRAMLTEIDRIRNLMESAKQYADKAAFVLITRRPNCERLLIELPRSRLNH